MRTIAALASALALLIPLAGMAVPTGLNIMPTAEVLGLGETRVTVESDGSGKLYAPVDASIYGTQAGLILGVEIGADQVTDRGMVYNAKWRFKGEGLITPALAVGAQNISSGEKIQYYLVATKSLLVPRVSAGLLRDENGDTVTMLGVGANIGMLAVKADRASGGVEDRSSISAGIGYRNFHLAGIHYDYENRPNEDTIELSYTHSTF